MAKDMKISISGLICQKYSEIITIYDFLQDLNEDEWDRRAGQKVARQGAKAL